MQIIHTSEGMGPRFFFSTLIISQTKKTNILPIKKTNPDSYAFIKLSSKPAQLVSKTNINSKRFSQTI